MNPTVQERLHFWDSNAAMAALALQKIAPDGDFSNLVVIIADMRDSVARLIVEAASDAHKLDLAHHEAKVEKKGEIPTAIMILEAHVAEGILTVLDHPIVAKGLSRVPPPGRVRAIVISGSAMLLHPPVAGIPSAGQG